MSGAKKIFTSVAGKTRPAPGERRLYVVSNILFIAVLAILFGWMVFKADYVGVHYDESYSCLHFSKDIHTARYNYQSTNNHVLNSILMCLGRHLFGDYVHYIRIFPLLSALLFFVSAAYIIKKVVKNPPLQVASLILILTVRSLFEYLYEARGYTYALSAMSLYIAAVFFLTARPAGMRRWPIVAVALALINFYSLSAMISAVLCMFSLNAAFILYSGRIYRDRKILPLAANACLIPVLTGLSLFFFYRPILTDILHVEQNPYVKDIAAGWGGWSSFVPFIRQLLIDQRFNTAGGGLAWCLLFFFPAAAGFILIAARAVKAVRCGAVADFIESHRFGLFLLLFFVVYFCVLFFYCVVLKRSPGMLRNQIFLLPLFLLVCVWCIDQLSGSFSGGFGRAATALIVFAVLAAGSGRTPYLRTLGSGVGIARPALERLKRLDPQADWAVCFSNKMNIYAMNMRYYRQFDYRFAITGPQECNVFICRPAEYPKGAACLDYDYFIRPDNCIVAIVKPLNTENTILQAVPKQKR